jgi:hypothetical protein
MPTKTKRKREEEDVVPALSSMSYETKVGLDPGKFNWNKSKQKKCFARHPWWKEMSNGNLTSKAWKNTCKKYSWWKEEMVKEVMTPM